MDHLPIDFRVQVMQEVQRTELQVQVDVKKVVDGTDGLRIIADGLVSPHVVM